MQTQDTYNRGGMNAFLFSIIFSLAFFVYVGVIRPGIDLKEVPEEAMSGAPAQAQAAAPAAVDISGVEKPWEPNEDMAKHGAVVYKANCAVCHGDTGQGDGPAGKALVPPPRNFVEGKWKQGGSSKDLYLTLQKGVPGTSMVGFGHLPKADRWALVQHIRSITNDKVADDPAALEAFAKTAN